MFNKAFQQLWQTQATQFGKKLQEASGMALEMFTNINKACQIYWVGIMNYSADFMDPYWIALQSFTSLEKEKLLKAVLLQSILDYTELYQFNLQIAEQGMNSSMKSFWDFHRSEVEKAMAAIMN